MKKSRLKWSVLAILLLLSSISGCNFANKSTSTPTITPAPTSTTMPTATVTPTAEKSFPTVEPLKVEMGIVRSFAPLGYFTYNNLDNFSGDSGWDMVDYQDDELSVYIAFTGSSVPEYSAYSSDEITEEFLNSLNSEMSGTIAIQGLPETLVIDSIDCLLYEVGGTFNGVNAHGNAFLTRLEGNRIVFGFGFSLKEPAEEVWAKRGEASFRAFIESLQFIRNDTVQRGCQVSTDPSYGYSMENPVQLGGNVDLFSTADFEGAGFDGVRREDMYLMLLSGPNGEKITNTRNGSITYGDTILDEYSITIEGDTEPKIIYVDIYHFSPPYAPLGFSCYDYLPFEEPR